MENEIEQPLRSLGHIGCKILYELLVGRNFVDGKVGLKPACGEGIFSSGGDGQNNRG